MSRQLDCYRVAPGRSPEQVACALAAKAFGQGYRVHLRAPDAAAAAALDALLWTFRADSFVPHQLLPAAADESAATEDATDMPPVTLGAGPPPPPGAGRSLLLLVGAAPVAGGEAFGRIAAVVAEGDDAAAHVAGELSDQARACGIELRSHHLSGAR